MTFDLSSRYGFPGSGDLPDWKIQTERIKMRKLRVLGLAFAAVLALSAVTASAASASLTIHSPGEKYPVTLSGTGENIGEHFQTEIGSVKCAVSHFTGTLNGPSTTVDVTPTYTGCEAFAGIAATVHHNGCEYRFTGTEHDAATASFTAHVGVVGCNTPATGITITAATCTIHVPQTGNENLTTSRITNMGSGTTSDITVKPEVTGITYNVTDGFGCPFNGGGHRKDGQYTTNAGGYITVTSSSGGVTIRT